VFVAPAQVGAHGEAFHRRDNSPTSDSSFLRMLESSARRRFKRNTPIAPPFANRLKDDTSPPISQTIEKKKRRLPPHPRITECLSLTTT